MDQFLARLAHSVSDAGDLETLTRPMLELLETITGLESTYLTTVDELRGVQYVLYSRNSKQLQIPERLSVPWEDTLCKRALDENRPYTNDVAGCWGDSDAARALGISTYISQPVRNLQGGLYGTLCAASSSKVDVSPSLLKILTLFSRLIGAQVDRERIVNDLRKTNQELSTHALSDPLTGVANRRAVEQELKHMLGQSQRDGSSIQVAFIDLDGFKAINDHHGHAVGDRFLVHIASRLVSATRTGDVVGRYGGDEFVIVTRLGNPAELQARLSRITEGPFSFGKVFFEYPGASVGVTAAMAGESNAEQLLKRADAAMYERKQARKKK